MNAKRTTQNARRKTLLAYHSIGKTSVNEAGAELYAVSVENFKKQLEAVCSLQSLVCSLTFDDGDITNYTNAYPVLKELGLKAYFFIIPPRIGLPGYMNWDEVKELRNMGMTIGSHGMTHRILTELSDSELDHELSASKTIIEEEIGESIDCVSIPRGFYNEKIIYKAKGVGYKAVFTSNPRDNDDFKRGRIVVRSDWDLEYFTRALNNDYPLKDRLITAAKNSVRNILGNGRYDRLRSHVLSRYEGRGTKDEGRFV